jgi:hypothetical protein
VRFNPPDPFTGHSGFAAEAVVVSLPMMLLCPKVVPSMNHPHRTAFHAQPFSHAHSKHHTLFLVLLKCELSRAHKDILST